MRPALILGLALALAGPAAAQNGQNNIQPVAPMGPGGPAQNIQPVAPMGPGGPAPAPQAAPQSAPGGPQVEQWGDDQNGGWRSFQSGPDGRGGHFEEEIVRQWGGGGQQWSNQGQQQWAPAQWGPPPCCGSAGNYPIPTYGYAAQNYGWPGQACCMGGGGEVSFSSSSSSYSSGVGGYLADGVWPGGYWGGGYWPGDGRFVGSRRFDYDSGWRDLPGGGPPIVAPR